MERFLEFLTPLVIAVKDNDYGFAIAILFVISLLAMTFAVKAHIIFRFICFMVVVAAALGLFSLTITPEQSHEIVTGKNGDLCLIDSNCESGHCYSGPHALFKGSGKNYCITTSMQCALPGTAGAKHGSVIMLNDELLTCKATIPTVSKGNQFLR